LEKPIKILIADDHSMFREGLKSLIAHFDGIKVIGEAASGEEALEKTGELLPDLVLMDISMPGRGGLKALKQIKETYPQVTVIMLTMASDVSSVFESVQFGASEYILKDACFSELHDKILQVMGVDKKSNFNPLPLEETNPGDSPESCPLTQRELEVLQQAAKGKENKEIASFFGISENTVKNHVSNIFQKLKVNDRTQAVVNAMQKGWI